LIVIAIETGGRWSREAIDFLSKLASARTRDAPAHTRASAYHYFFRRWSRLLATACANSFAASLTDNVAQPCCSGADGPLRTSFSPLPDDLRSFPPRAPLDDPPAHTGRDAPPYSDDDSGNDGQHCAHARANATAYRGRHKNRTATPTPRAPTGTTDAKTHARAPAYACAGANTPTGATTSGLANAPAYTPPYDAPPEVGVLEGTADDERTAKRACTGEQERGAVAMITGPSVEG
jgi:hypothetical protein